MRYKKEHINAIATKLNSMPEVEKNQEYTKKETVKLLAKEIKLLEKRGYSLEQISETLCGEGFDIKAASLKQYLYRKKRAKKETKNHPKKVTKSEENKKTEIVTPQIIKKKRVIAKKKESKEV